jgi:protocatechuate 3,4-dioxygenase beta subunit
LTIPGTGVSFVDDFFGTPSQTPGRNWMELDLDLNLPPPPEGTLSGTVTDGSGSAVSGVDVVISDSGTGSTVQTVTTDSSGNYSATLEPNDYEVTVNADGYESFSDLTSVTGGQTTTLDITLTESGPSPGTLEGTVTDTSGSAVGSIPIGIYAADADPSTSDPLQITNTDSSGNYSVSRAPDDYKIYIDVDGYNTYTETVTINSGETTTADVQLTDETASPGTVTGTVTDNHGNALDGLTIEFLDATSGDVVKTVTTDSQGSYSVELSPTGYTLSVNASSYESYSTSLTVVDGGSLTQDIQLTVSLPPLPGQSNPPQDADGDGNYEDIRGDGSVDVFDVQTLFANLNDPAVQENSRYFNFQGDDPSEVTIFDVQALFSKV